MSQHRLRLGEQSVSKVVQIDDFNLENRVWDFCLTSQTYKASVPNKRDSIKTLCEHDLRQTWTAISESSVDVNQLWFKFGWNLSDGSYCLSFETFEAWFDVTEKVSVRLN